MSLHIFLSHFTDWFEKRGYTYGEITEEGFEEKHKASKGAAHRQRMRLLFALQDLAVVDLMAINDRSQHDPILAKVLTEGRGARGGGGRGDGRVAIYF